MADNVTKSENQSPLAGVARVTEEDFYIAEEEYNKSLAKYKDATNAITELSKFFKDMSEVNKTYSTELMQAIDSQFKQVKSVGAGVPIEVNAEKDNELNTPKLKVIKQISDSKKFGPST